jgi:plasmid stabilization system protein ParE
MRLRYTPRAQAGLDMIYGFIDRRNPEAARTVKEIIENRIAWLADFPLIAPETSKHGVRELTMVRFPYKVMGSTGEYQNRARRCAGQAQMVSSAVDRARWRQLADQWMALSRMPLRKDDPAWHDKSAAVSANRHREQ